jgi:hypothetical protein
MPGIPLSEGRKHGSLDEKFAKETKIRRKKSHDNNNGEEFKKTRSFSISLMGQKKHEKKQGQIFGVALADILAREGGKLPLLVEQCINFVRQHGTVIFLSR